MYYGFDLTTNRCLFTANGEISTPPNCRVVEGEWGDDIANLEYIQLDDEHWTVGPRQPTTEELVVEATARRYNELQWASGELSIWLDRREFGDTSPVVENAINLLKRYRLDVYAVDPSKPTEILWPTKPSI